MRATKAEVRIHKKGSMLAFANVEFDGCMKVSGWKLFEGKDGRKYDIGFPSEKKKDADGNDKWWNFVFVDFKSEEGKALMSSIKEAVAKEYENQGSSGGSGGSGGGNNGGWDGDDDIPF